MVITIIATVSVGVAVRVAEDEGASILDQTLANGRRLVVTTSVPHLSKCTQLLLRVVIASTCCVLGIVHA